MAKVKRIIALLDRLEKKGSLTKKQLEEFVGIARKALNKDDRYDFRECSMAQICLIFKKDKQTIRKWMGQGMPYTLTAKQYMFDPGTVLNWRIGRQKELDKMNEGPSQLEIAKMEAELKIREENARKLKRLNDMAEKRIIEIKDLKASLNEIGRKFQVNAGWIQRVHGAKVGRDINKMIDDTIQDFDKTFPDPDAGLFSDKNKIKKKPEKKKPAKKKKRPKKKRDK